MADRQIFQLTARTLALSDVFASQDAAGASEAGKNTIQDIADLIPSSTPYKQLCVSVTQSGSAAPTVTTHFTDLSATPVWTRQSTGTYIATLAGAFLAGKVPKIEGFIKNGSNIGSVILNTFTIQRVSDNTIALGTFTNGTLTDGLLTDQYFQIPIFD